MAVLVTVCLYSLSLLLMTRFPTTTNVLDVGCIDNIAGENVL